MTTMAERLSMVRARGAFGRRPSRKALSQASRATGLPVTVHHYDPATDETTLDTFQNVEEVVKRNVEEYNSGHDGYSPSRDLQKVASIPLVEVEKLYRQGINIFDRNDWPKITAKLDSGEWLKYRTAPGRISRRPTRETFVPARKVHAGAAPKKLILPREVE